MERSTTANKLLSDPSAVKWGYLSKKGGERRNWTHRFFILKKCHDSTYVIEYHKDHKNLKKPKGVISLNKSCTVSYSNRKPFCFSVKTESREYLIQGKSQAEVDDWKRAIERCINPSGDHILKFK